MTDDREAILRALGAEGREGALGAEGAAAPLPVPPAAAEGSGGDAAVAAFAAMAAANQSEVVEVRALAELPAVVAAFLQRHGMPLQVLCEEEFLSLAWQAAGVAAEHRAPEKDDGCGVTGVTAAAADAGVMLVADDVRHRLTLSLLPPYHVAVVPREAVCADLAGLWQRLPQPLRRGNALIGGPSRTADIEQTLTLGVHGPVKVLVVIAGGGGGNATAAAAPPT